MPDIFTNSQSEKNQPISRPTRPFTAPIGLFSAFCQNPSGIWYKNQTTDEELILFLRAKFITNLLRIITIFILLLLPPTIQLILRILTIDTLFLPVVITHSLPILIPF